MNVQRPTPETPELLAPAGSLETFFAAMDHGADAVYVGLHAFSARAKAKNFSLPELERMLAYAHHHGRRVFVTLNTLVKQHELPQLCETLAALEALRVDAVILQDMAVWRLAKSHFPDLELHASTQLTIHNVAGVRQLEAMGFTRAVLARELTLEEIAAIRAATTIELEHFVHGALCFSFSGQCSFSSWLGGKSGNRGRCAQPCRRRYRFRGKEGYYFSPNDLSAIDLLPRLAQAGVCSLKIEGRMKSAEYVATVVEAYRKVLDAPPGRQKDAAQLAKEQLKGSFGRLPTKGFLSGPSPTDIAVPSIKGATGRLLGEITSVRGTTISLRSRDRLHVGDRLRIQPRSDKAGTSFTVKQLTLAGKPSKMAPAGASVVVSTPFRDAFHKGDAVFKVSSEQAYTLSEQGARKRLARLQGSPLPLDLHVTLQGETLQLQADCAGQQHAFSFPVTTYPAEQAPLDASVLRDVFSRSGDVPLVLRTFTCAPLPAVVIPPSRLKQVRRELFSQLGKVLGQWRDQQQHEHLQSALESLAPSPTTQQHGALKRRCVLRDGRDVHVLGDDFIDDVILPLQASTVEGYLGSRHSSTRHRERVIWDVPMILLGEREKDAAHLIQAVLHKGMKRFRLNNLGHFTLFAKFPDAELECSWRLFTLNSEAARAWQELGAMRAETYLEDDRDNLSALFSQHTGLPLGTTAYAPVPLITSRIEIRSLPSRAQLVSDRGDSYRVERRHNLTVLSSESDFSLSGHLLELQSLGATTLTFDLSHLGPFSPRGKQVLEALRQDQEIPGTLPFNYLHTLE